MNIGDDGDLEFQIRRPLRRRNLIARDLKLQLGFAETIGGRRNAGNAETGKCTQEVTAREHGNSVVMQLPF